MLAAAATAWPDGQPPLQTLLFEPGRLTLGPGWADPQHAAFAERARAAGYAAESQGRPAGADTRRPAMSAEHDDSPAQRHTAQALQRALASWAGR
jgi:hypothetical protein